MRSDLTTYLDVLADEPALATTLHVEVLAAGPAALEHRAELLGVLASRIANLGDLAHRDDGAVRELPPAVFALFTGGLDELIRDRLGPDPVPLCTTSPSRCSRPRTRCSARELQAPWQSVQTATSTPPPGANLLRQCPTGGPSSRD